MFKILTICAFYIWFFNTRTYAQSSRQDSLFKIAVKDAKSFRLNETDFKKFRKNKLNGYSDYFKPRKENVSDTTLLSDSAYVKAFRMVAYNKTFKRNSTSDSIFKGVIVYLSLSLVAGFVVLLALLSK